MVWFDVIMCNVICSEREEMDVGNEIGGSWFGRKDKREKLTKIDASWVLE